MHYAYSKRTAVLTYKNIFKNQRNEYNTTDVLKLICLFIILGFLS